MQTTKQRAVAILLTVMLAGCATTNAPDKFLSEAEKLQEESYGGWITAHFYTEKSENEVQGELLAVSRDSLFVLSHSQIVSVPVDLVTTARLEIFLSNANSVGLWTTGEILLTVSHGWFLGLTAPIWIFTGYGSAIARSHTPIFKYPGDSWEKFTLYARFPGGMPSNVRGNKPEPGK